MRYVYLLIILVLLVGCSSSQITSKTDSFPYEKTGIVWDGGDGYLYTVAQGKSRDMQMSMDKANDQCRMQFINHLNLSYTTMRDSRAIRNEFSRENNIYCCYTLMKLNKSANGIE
jgi:hypothetical protein